jgi:N-acetylglucosaminyldiphosphoundecaprenol N-acetyl-beta-D-mannosaminyltransferase
MDREKCPTYDLLGVKIAVLNLSDATQRIVQASNGENDPKPCAYVCVTDVNGILRAQKDTEYREILNEALFCTPDGMPTVWMGKIKGHPSIERVCGRDLLSSVLQRSQNNGIKHYLHGGRPGTAQALKEKLEARFPGVQITGASDHPMEKKKQRWLGFGESQNYRDMTPSEEETLIEKIGESQADIVWVCLGTPRQEKFMADLAKIQREKPQRQNQLRPRLLIGVGAAFDFHSGRAKTPPAWVQKAGLEWLFRVVHEPLRLGPRYLKIVPQFLMLAAKDLLRPSRP